MATPTDTGIFAGTGSPPVILGFLAVGLFVVALIVLFGFRRFHRGRFNAPLLRPPPFQYPFPDVNIGEKPKFWDVYLHPDPSKWNEMQPLCASLPEGVVKPEPTLAPAQPSPTAVERLWKALRRRDRKAEPPTDIEAGKVKDNYCQMQVAVTILMPSQHHHETNEDGSVYEIGLAEVRFPSAAATDLL